MADSDLEDKEGLARLRERMRTQLRQGIKEVNRLEKTVDPRELDQWIQKEIDRYGGRRVQVDDE